VSRKAPPPERPLGNNPFAALKDRLPEREALPSAPAPSAESLPKAPKGPARAVIRMERKGHGGKEVTVVEALDLPKVELKKWLKSLKASLGCGGTLSEDETALILQGDHRERLAPLLKARGVRKLSVG
jgi:translation initiation factor 1